ncbi:MAG: metallophosphoesterase family protein [Cytophagia bacterium]|nr:metallophosphoesterase family protein [Cytophagia bacterium]
MTFSINHQLKSIPITRSFEIIQKSLLFLLLTGFFSILNAQERAYKVPEFAKNWSKPGQHPDHIMINYGQDPATTASVTWRTSEEISVGYAEIAVATAAPKFWRNAVTIEAVTETLDATDVDDAQVTSNYHSVTFEKLQPETIYAYRVGDGKIWSEWIQFKTASDKEAPFSFLYVGDAQNYILELWSRLIREGYRKGPGASFIIHAGDMINNAHSERQWHEWYTAGGWIHSMLPSISVPGNHEYGSLSRENSERSLSVQWRPQFTLPENGVEGLEETNYYIDHQGMRIIALNSLEKFEEQAEWLEKVLSNNPNRWTVATYHHPLYSASAGRANDELRSLWKPLFDKYKVDLALQGHDHAYARGRVEPYLAEGEQNVLGGLNKRDYTGTVYVVSVSGGKMYDLRPNAWDDWPEAERDRAAENTQLVQLINVDGDKLSYQSFTATGELYDAFDLIKQPDGKPNKFIERRGYAIDERRHDNTISYEDQLPANTKAEIEKKYQGYETVSVSMIDNTEFKGYYAQLREGRNRLDLTVSSSGDILKANAQQLRFSQTDMEYTSDKKLLTLNLKLFLNDLNEALGLDPQSNELAFGQSNESPRANAMLLDYLKKFIYVKVNGKELELQIKSKQLTGEGNNTTLEVYFEYQQTLPLRSLEVKNAVFTELFPGQNNLVYADFDKRSEVLVLNKTNPSQQLDF